MSYKLTEQELKKFEKLKGLSRCLADYVMLIESVENNPSRDIQVAIESVHYYSRLFKELE